MSTLSRLHHEMAQRAEALGWKRDRLTVELGTRYGKHNIMDLNFVEAHQFKAVLQAAWDVGFEAGLVRARIEDGADTAAHGSIPWIFRQ